MSRPTNLRELAAYLTANPRVRKTVPRPAGLAPIVREESFLTFENGRLWFLAEGLAGTFIPISCTLTPQDAQAETGILFDEEGFTVTKFGASIRVDYLPSASDS
jgi:hypothetical protein